MKVYFQKAKLCKQAQPMFANFQFAKIMKVSAEKNKLI